MNKKTITAVIEFADNNLSAYIPGVYSVIAVGDTTEEVKKNLAEAVDIYIEECKADGIEVEEELQGEFEIEYKLDLATFLGVYSKVLSKSGLETLTGINQKQLWHYANGKSKPRRSTIDKVAEAIHKFAAELQAVEFA